MCRNHPEVRPCVGYKASTFNMRLSKREKICEDAPIKIHLTSHFTRTTVDHKKRTTITGPLSLKFRYSCLYTSFIAPSPVAPPSLSLICNQTSFELTPTRTISTNKLKEHQYRSLKCPLSHLHYQLWRRLPWCLRVPAPRVLLLHHPRQRKDEEDRTVFPSLW